MPDLSLYLNVVGGIQYVPTTFFVDSEGKLVGQVYVGARDREAWNAVMEETMEALAAT